MNFDFIKKWRLFLLLILLVLIQPVFAVDYSKFDASNIDSVNLASKAYQSEYKNKKGTTEAEHDFLKFEKFYLDFIAKQNDIILFKNIPYKGSYLAEYKRLNKIYNRYGLHVYFEDSLDFHFEIYEKYLKKEFAKYLSKDWQELINFEVYKDGIWNFDGRILLSKSDVKKIIKFYKYFYNKYPDFVERDKIKESIEFFEDVLKTYPII